MSKLSSLLPLALYSLVFLAGCERAETPPRDAPPTDPAPAAAEPAPAAAPVQDAAVPPIILREMTVGDRACYLTLVDARGTEQHEMAVFEVCERDDLLGQRVLALYGSGEVIAESCYGDPECDETETVQLVIELKATD